MTALPLLDRDDLYRLTDRKTRSGVVQWLKARGWVYELGATGWPKVSADYARVRLGAANAGSTAEPADDQPNWNALRAA